MKTPVLFARRAVPAFAHRIIRTLPTRATAVIAIVLLFLGLGTGVASAHVTVNPGEVVAGTYAKITFRVPNESPKASTDSIQVLLPTDHPFPSVSLMPVPGWVATPKTVALNPPVTEGTFKLTQAVESVTWSAQDGNGVQPGEFQEFSLSVGPVPDVASLVIPAIQTYSDGSVVKWSDVAAPGVDPHSLDHPAPVLTIAQADSSAATTGGAGGQPSLDGAASPTVTGSSPQSLTISASDSTAQILAAIALLVAAIAVLIAVLAWRRRPAASRDLVMTPVAAASASAHDGVSDDRGVSADDEVPGDTDGPDDAHREDPRP